MCARMCWLTLRLSRAMAARQSSQRQTPGGAAVSLEWLPSRRGVAGRGSAPGSRACASMGRYGIGGAVKDLGVGADNEPGQGVGGCSHVPSAKRRLEPRQMVVRSCGYEMTRLGVVVCQFMLIGWPCEWNHGDTGLPVQSNLSTISICAIIRRNLKRTKWVDINIEKGMSQPVRYHRNQGSRREEGWGCRRTGADSASPPSGGGGLRQSHQTTSLSWSQRN